MNADRPAQELVVVTGMSGAGRSTVADALEDLDWYVVDNLPPQMLRPLVDLAGRAGSTLPHLAAVVDVRGGELFGAFAGILAELRESIPVRVMFLDASDAALVRRFESVRRPHPLQGSGTILDGITAERRLLAGLREAADLVVDTSELNVHQLADAVRDAFASPDRAAVAVTVQSFGFKYGLPPDADLVADVRFLPNPFWDLKLRPLTGLDAPVSERVLSSPGAAEFVEAYLAALSPVLSGYARENKRHATIAVGCTGGKHRSVAIATRLAELLDAVPGVAVHVKHRDLGRE